METIRREFLDVYVSNLREQVKLLELYLRQKLDERDFHGVQDAASDIRDIEAKIQTVEHLIRMHTKA